MIAALGLRAWRDASCLPLGVTALWQEDEVMRFPWQAREYERTCTECGYAWRVPQQFARSRVLSIYGATSGGAGLAGPADAQLQAGRAMIEPAEALRTCAKCGSGHYTKRAAAPS